MPTSSFPLGDISGAELLRRAERYLRFVASTGVAPSCLGPYGATKNSYIPARYQPKWSRTSMEMVWVPVEIFLDSHESARVMDWHGVVDTERLELHLRRLSDDLNIPWSVALWPGKRYDPDEPYYCMEWPDNYLALYAYGGIAASEWTLRAHVLQCLAAEVDRQHKEKFAWAQRSPSTA